MYDDNENFRLDDEEEEEYSSLRDKIVDIIENGANDYEDQEEHIIDVTTELDINRKNREGYEQLMRESSTKLDDYWDSNNPFVRALLLGLLIFIAIGAIIIIGSYIAS